MLTTTYSIMVLNGEQQKARSLVASLEQYLHQNVCDDFACVGTDTLQQAFRKLATAYAYCLERKVERYLIPSIKNLAPDAEPLVSSLEARSLYSMRILEYVYQQIQRVAAAVEVDIETLVTMMHLYCRHMFERFSLEEGELLPLAYRLLSESDWFEIASQCLSETKASATRSSRSYPAGIIVRGRDEQRYLH